MNFISLEFLLLMIVATLSLRLATNRSIKSAVLLTLNAIFFSSFFISLADTLPILSMVTLGYIFLQIVACFRSSTWLGIIISSIVLLFTWLKGYSLITLFVPLNKTPFIVVGLSYILFRILHLLIDIAQGSKSVPPVLAYLNYCLFFPTFVSGPIQRYENFEAQMRQQITPLTIPVLHSTLCRILLGIMLIIVFSAYASNAIDWLKSAYYTSIVDPTHWIKTAVLFAMISFAVLLKLYTNFSGSMHIVIGIGTLLGFKLPENFNKPYLAKNFLDFWARWHITLSEWIKFYLFNPLLKWLTQYFPSPRAANYLGAIAFFISFLVIGLWHGSTLLFFGFGIMLGIGATINKLWQQLCIKIFGKTTYKSLVAQKWYFQISRGLTLSYISIALICLWLTPETIHTNMLQIATLSLIILTIVFTLLGSAIDSMAWLIKYSGLTIKLPSSNLMKVVSMAFMLWFVVNHIGAFGSNTPEFIYKGF